MPSYRIGEGATGWRADVALAQAAGIARAQARRWIDEGHVRLNAAVCRPAQRVRAGDVLEADPPAPAPATKADTSPSQVAPLRIARTAAAPESVLRCTSFAAIAFSVASR